MEQFNVFVSYASEDKQWVRKFVDDLRKGGLSVFFAEDTLKPGVSVSLNR